MATASFDKTVTLWDARTQKPTHVLKGHRDDVIGLSFDSSHTLLASGSTSPPLLVWF
jgi:WD40 repeat protein